MNCNKYHAIIPSFSLAGTSLGTAEVEDYIKNRQKNKSRREAGKALLKAGVSFKHLKHIEKMFHRSIKRMKDLLPQIGQNHLHGIDWCKYVLKPEDLKVFIYKLNAICLGNRINAVFCNRYNILQFRIIKPGHIFSNNMNSSIIPEAEIDSS